MVHEEVLGNDNINPAIPVVLSTDHESCGNIQRDDIIVQGEDVQVVLCHDEIEGDLAPMLKSIVLELRH